MTPGNRRIRAVPEVTAVSESTEPPSPPRGRVVSAFRTAAGLALVVSTSIGVAWAARRHVLGSPRFAIMHVEVTGNDRLPGESVVAESGLALGSNVFAADLDLARSRILADPWVADAQLVRRLPGTILVRVTERRPAAIVAMDETYLASADGEPFKRLEPGDPMDFPLVTGLRAEALAEDRPGALRTVQRAIDLAAEFEHGALAKRAPLQEVHLGADGSFTIIVGHAGMELVLGPPPFRRKLDQAARVVAELERRGAKADAIMLDNDTRPERVVVRMR
ncbi:MAG TPA: FtsQ-type POTRA domain-containing protein [Polyangiaceae bacterium]|nr:FtsQ-type POTRA domain-containing protein [Polyangiaceae bacterium]